MPSDLYRATTEHELFVVYFVEILVSVDCLYDNNLREVIKVSNKCTIVNYFYLGSFRLHVFL